MYWIAPLGAWLLVMIGLVAGGIWPALAIVWLIVFAVAPLSPAHTQNSRQSDGTAAQTLACVLGALHFPLLGLAVITIANAQHGFTTALLQFVACGLYIGQVSNAVAHELIHRREKPLFQLGTWVFISNLFGHHISAHRLVHHVWVATPNDPNTAKVGQSFFRFALTSWLGSFLKGLQAETRARQGLKNPYFLYVFGALAFVFLSWLAADIAGVLVLLGLSAYSVSQLLMTDYVQHYGLTRDSDQNGQYEPFSPRHAWDCNSILPRNLMVNAPLHARHHERPDLAFDQLTPSIEAPQMPYPLAVMAAIALFPRKWRKIVHPILLAHKTR